MAVNIIGSFVMGVFIEMLVRRFGGSNELRLFVATGILGGFTTFSAFSLDFAVLWERGAMVSALSYVTGERRVRDYGPVSRACGSQEALADAIAPRLNGR